MSALWKRFYWCWFDSKLQLSWLYEFKLLKSTRVPNDASNYDVFWVLSLYWNQRIKATRAHADSTMKLTSGTLPPLHRSPSQQWTSHLASVSPREAAITLQTLSLTSQCAFVAQSLEITFTSLPDSLPVMSDLTQRSWPAEQVALILVWSHASKLSWLSHW